MLIASCHCQAVRMELPGTPAYLNQCNCSVCRRYGVLWGYYAPDTVRLLGAPEATEVYAWNGRHLEFHRCRVCGCVAYWKAVEGDRSRMGINARLCEPADIADVPVKHSPGPP